MSVVRLTQRRVEKVWGRRDLPDVFGGVYEGDEPLGELWFEHPAAADVDLLIKYLFTSEKLSIQVHPGDQAARRAGYKRGKDEVWIILRAEPGATIGLGLKKQVSREALRQAALDGSIEELVEWRPAAVGDVIYSPAGTIHALGPGLTLIEIQQNVDITYRLYDYGRPRELHLEQGVSCALREPYSPPPPPPGVRADGREILAAGRAFVLERWFDERSGMLCASENRPVWLVPLRRGGTIGEQVLEPGSVWLANGVAPLNLHEGAELIVAYPGGEVEQELLI